MKITKIGFGYTKNEGSYENSKIYLEAQLEDWENASQSLDILRSQVAAEMKLPKHLHDLREQVTNQKTTLRILRAQTKKEEENLERAQRAWENFSEFLTTHGVNPESLTIEDFSAIRELHSGTPEQENTIVYSKDSKADEYSDDYASNEDYEENPEYNPLPF